MTITCENCGASQTGAGNFCGRCGCGRGEPLLRSTTPISRLMSDWRRINRSLTRKDVLRILGQPKRIDPADDAPDGTERWTYEYVAVDRGAVIHGQINISAAESRVRSWIEPEWDRIGAI